MSWIDGWIDSGWTYRCSSERKTEVHYLYLLHAMVMDFISLRYTTIITCHFKQISNVYMSFCLNITQ